jgi:hypothetical protein
MNGLRVLLFAMAVAVLAAAGWWYHYTGTPQYSLALLAGAVKAKDYETARYFVDDERIADTASKTFLDAAITRATTEMKADDNPLSGFGIAALQMMAPRIREMAKDRVKDSIRQALSGDATLTNTKGAQRWDSDRFSQLRIEECAVSGKTAEVVIRGIPQPNPAQITEVHLRMARIPDSRNWRIEEIPELTQAYLKLLDLDALQKTPERTQDLVGDKTIPAQNLSDLYSPERVAEYCRIHPTGFYGAVGSASGVSCPVWSRQNQSKNIAAQTSRDDWKQSSFDLEAHLDHTLANAPFTSGERTQIYQVIEKFALTEKQKEEPETLMSARVGSIQLADDGSQQILVQGPYAAFCGASGNCPMWIFTTSPNGQLRLALEMFGNAVILRTTSSQGFHDFATASHFSAYEEYFSVYRWNGDKYDQIDCYKATHDSDNSNPPAIANCQR